MAKPVPPPEPALVEQAVGGPAEPPDALVFVPGIGPSEHMEPRLVAELLCWEMRQRADDRTADFAVEPTSVGTDVVYRIERLGGGTTTPVVDLYCLPPATVFAAEKAPSSAIRRVVTLALTVLAGILIWLGAWFRAGRRIKSFQQMLQLLFGMVVLLILGTYFLTALYALAEVVVVTVRGGPADTALVRWPQWAVLLAAAAAVLVPDVRDHLTRAAEMYLRMMRYVWGSAVRNRLTGRLQDLVDRINRRHQVRNIHLLGFSFGALVVLDTVYPAGSSHPAPLQQVASISTIGCPFDLLRMLQPAYAQHRREATTTTPKWINVYTPTDVLASTFGAHGDDQRPDPARTGPAESVPAPAPAPADPTPADLAPADLAPASPAPERTAPAPGQGFTLVDGSVRRPDVNAAWNSQLKLSLVNLLMLHSIFVHGHYWDRRVGARTALGPVVDTLFAGTEALR